MEYVVIALVASGAAMLTFFSGFGLGTILMPVFALFFPVEIAIALTAVVHLANNLFKTSLIWRAINFRVVFLFALPAALAAFLGAYVLTWFSN
ncbi:MAG: sulfite exporter TauE/SafE family protein, partial [Sphingobacteriia bacterium]|nr:sulfite exporter TauE/SafE family protein [Sphingobacteriia bacterium]